MQYDWNVIISRYKDYFGNGRFGWIFVLSLLFLVFWRRGGKTRKALLWPTLLLGSLIFCPWTARQIMRMIGEDVYWRAYWLLPVILLAAYAGTEFVSIFRAKWKQGMAAILCIGLIVVNGSFLFTDQYFGESDNVYKLPSEVVAVADAINEHAAVHDVARRTVSPIGIATYLRIYDGSMRQHYGRSMIAGRVSQTQLYCQVNADEPNFELLAERARKAKCRYVVLMRKVDDEEIMNGFNYEKIYDGPYFKVYFDRNYQKD